MVIMKISSCVTLHGNCRDAVEFYKEIFKLTEVNIQTFNDKVELFGNNIPNECKNLVYRAELKIQSDESVFSIIMCDSPSLIFLPGQVGYSSNIDNITYEITSDNKEWTEMVYNKLLDGGKTNIPLQKKLQYELFGSLIDRFGICWIISCCN